MLGSTVTLLTLQNRIGTRLQDPTFQSISLDAVTDVLNQVLKYYKFQRFWFNDAEQDINLVQGQSVIPPASIPANFLCELQDGALTIFYGNIYYPLEKRSSEIFDSENISAIGLPYIYTYRAEQYEVYFLPNIAYLLKFRYLKDYPDLVSGTDTNDFLQNADMMIYYNALSRIYGEFKQDSKMEAYYTSRFQDEEANVSRRTSTLSGTGTLVLNSNLLS